MKSCKTLLILMSLLSLIQAPVPRVAWAKSAPSELSYSSREILKKLKPLRAGEMLAEYYFRIESHLTSKMKKEFAGLLTNRGNWIMGKVQLIGDEAIFSEGRLQLRLKVEEKSGARIVKVNGQILTKAELDSPSLLILRLEKILSQTARKQAGVPWWLHSLLPEAQAIEWGTILIGVAVAAAAVWAVKEYTKKDEVVACTATQCCQVGTSYQEGCCSTLGGTQILGYATCPVGQTPQGLQVLSTTATSTSLGTSTTTVVPVTTGTR